MPTWEALDAFYRELAQLTPEQRKAFRRSVDRVVEDLKNGQGFRAGLRVKRVRGAPGLFEMTWAPDGRALFSYGPEVRVGETHIIWASVGTHSILP